MESSQKKTAPMVEDSQQGSSDAPLSEQTPPEQPDAVVMFSSHDTTPLDAGIAAAIATAAGLSENETILEPPRPPEMQDSVAAPTSLQQEGNEMEAIDNTVTAAVSENELLPVTSTTTTTTRGVIVTTATKSTAETMAELDRQTGLVQRKWEEMFSRLEIFKHKEGHCLVPNRYPADPQLGSWVSTQRRQYKLMTDGDGSEATSMTQARASRLESLGFQWSTSDPRHVPWEQRYEELVRFRDTYGHSQVPIGWEENIPLSNWVSTQRQEYKLLQKGRSSRLSDDRINMLNKVEFVWEAQRGGPRRKRKATVAVPPRANPIELLGSNIRERVEYGTVPGLSLLGGVADLPFVNMGMNAAVMQAAAAAAAATPHWGMLGYGAFQASPGSATVAGGPPGVFPNAMLFPMAQQQMPWAMAAMTRFGGATMPSTTDAASAVELTTPSAGTTAGTTKTEGESPRGRAKADSAAPVASAAADPVEAPSEAASTCTTAAVATSVELKTPVQVLINPTEESPPQAPETIASGLTTDSGGAAQTTSSVATYLSISVPSRLAGAAEATSEGTDTSIHLEQTVDAAKEASATTSDTPKDVQHDLPRVEEEDEPETAQKENGQNASVFQSNMI